MSDYAIPDETALVYPARDLDAASECVQRLMKDDGLRRKLVSNMRELLKSKIGTREDNMRQLRLVLKGKA
jgi:hypothetical protein